MKYLNGIELLNKIKNKELKNNTKINVLRYNDEFGGIYTVVANLIYKDNELLWDKNSFRVSMLYQDYKFKIEKGLKLHDLVNYCGYEWYVIDLKDNQVKLMMKNTLKVMTYSDDNSNDYCESNVIKYLTNEFLPRLKKNELIEMTTNYDEDKLAVSLVRIPTLREIEKLPMSIRQSDNSYWTMTSSYSVSEDCCRAHVFVVGSNGYLSGYGVNNLYGVRPVITLNAESLN